MSRKHLKPRDKVTQRMTRDGVVLENHDHKIIRHVG